MVVVVTLVWIHWGDPSHREGSHNKVQWWDCRCSIPLLIAEGLMPAGVGWPAHSIRANEVGRIRQVVAKI